VGSAPRHSVILTPTYVRTEWVFDFKPAHTPEREREVHGTKKLHEAKTVFHGRLCIFVCQNSNFGQEFSAIRMRRFHALLAAFRPHTGCPGSMRGLPRAALATVCATALVALGDAVSFQLSADADFCLQEDVSARASD
jgi:hypothetical protein